MDDNKLNHLKMLYESNCSEEAFEYIELNNINVLEDEFIAFSYIKSCMSKGLYEKSIILKNDFMEKFSSSNYIKELEELFPSDTYKEKAKKYNKKKTIDISGDCCYAISNIFDSCEICDICIYTEAGDSGCIYIDTLCCFFD